MILKAANHSYQSTDRILFGELLGKMEKQVLTSMISKGNKTVLLVEMQN